MNKIWVKKWNGHRKVVSGNLKRNVQGYNPVATMNICQRVHNLMQGSIFHHLLLRQQNNMGHLHSSRTIRHWRYWNFAVFGSEKFKQATWRRSRLSCRFDFFSLTTPDRAALTFLDSATASLWVLDGGCRRNSLFTGAMALATSSSGVWWAALFELVTGWSPAASAMDSAIEASGRGDLMAVTVLLHLVTIYTSRVFH